MSRRRPAARLLLGSAVALTAFLALAVAGAATRDSAPATDPRAVTFDVRGADGGSLGQVVLRAVPSRGATEVEAQLYDVPRGYHSVLIDDEARCEESRFAEQPAGTDRGIGQDPLPPVLALDDGTAAYTVRTDRIDVARLVDGDGSAIVVQGERGRVGCGTVG